MALDDYSVHRTDFMREYDNLIARIADLGRQRGYVLRRDLACLAPSKLVGKKDDDDSRKVEADPWLWLASFYVADGSRRSPPAHPAR